MLPDVLWLKISEYFHSPRVLLTFHKTCWRMHDLFVKEIRPRQMAIHQRRMWLILLKSNMPDMLSLQSLGRLQATGKLIRSMREIIDRKIHGTSGEIVFRRRMEIRQRTRELTWAIP